MHPGTGFPESRGNRGEVLRPFPPSSGRRTARTASSIPCSLPKPTLSYFSNKARTLGAGQKRIVARMTTPAGFARTRRPNVSADRSCTNTPRPDDMVSQRICRGPDHSFVPAAPTAEACVRDSNRAAFEPTGMRAGSAVGGARERTLIPVDASVGWYQPQHPLDLRLRCPVR